MSGCVDGGPTRKPESRFCLAGAAIWVPRDFPLGYGAPPELRTDQFLVSLSACQLVGASECRPSPRYGRPGPERGVVWTGEGGMRDRVSSCCPDARAFPLTRPSAPGMGRPVCQRRRGRQEGGDGWRSVVPGRRFEG